MRLKCPTSLLLLLPPLTFASDWPWVIGSGGRTALTPRAAVSTPFFRVIIQVFGGETGHLAKVSVEDYLYGQNLKSWNSIGSGRSSQSHSDSCLPAGEAGDDGGEGVHVGLKDDIG
jgi:hypothetical protein